MKKVLLTLAIGLASQFAFAQDAKPAFKGESEASVIVIDGVSSSETYGAKTNNIWNMSDADILTVFGKYMQTRSAGTETAKLWEAGLRYDRVIITDTMNIFIRHKAEHDPYNGIFVQRDTTDAGVKYVFVKTDELNWFGELGYAYTSTYSGLTPAPNTDRYNAGNVRVYTEASYKFSPTINTKFWVEHLANLKDSENSQTNYELSVSATLTSIFALKSAYLVNHSHVSGSTDKKTLTTSLVATY